MSTSWQDLAGLNPSISNPNLIYPGQQILLPNFETYTVKPGDTLSGIAVAYDKQQVNNVVNPEDNLAEDPDIPDEDPLDEEEESNIESPDTEDEAEDDEKPDPYEDSSRDVSADSSTDLQLGSNKSTSHADPGENPLDAYASYTYGITLFALTKRDYNEMVDNPLGFQPSKALISSAGRYRNVRDKNFKEDFYFESFKVTTIIGANPGARNTNAITMDFTIIEPYGMTLLDRIMDISMNEIAAQNYLDIPYLLRVEFFGGDDEGNMKKIPEHTKNFPIKFISFKIKAGVKGAEYAVQAVPFNHAANMESIQSIKTRMEITATTVNDFFANGNDARVAEEVDSHRKNAESYAYQSGQKGAGGGRGAANPSDPRLIGSTAGSQDGVDTVPDATPPGPFKSTSFTSAYNEWNIAATKTKDAKYADTISFVIDKDIARSKIVDPKKNSVKRTGSTTPQSAAQGAEGKDTKAVDLNTVVHSFEAGTTVNEIVNAIIPNSEFFLNQVKDPSKQSKTKAENETTSDSVAQDQATATKLWRIIPKVKLGEFDSQRNIWGKNITYYVKKYNVYQQRDKRFPKSPPPKPVKRYDYMYTGKNKSIINFDIDFNALFYTAQQIDRGNTETTAGPQAAPTASDVDSTQKNSGKSTIAPSQQQNVGTTTQTSTSGANNRSETQNAKSALQSIYSSFGGDMINLKMQIIGDPHFIKQDDLFVSPSDLSDTTSDSPSPFISNQMQSLRMDDGEIFCYVTFKTPSDFNDETGMYNLHSSSKYQVSEFSGYYRILKVESEFRRCKFIQTVDTCGQPEQDSPNSSSNKNDHLDTQRKDSLGIGNKQGEDDEDKQSVVEEPEQDSPNPDEGPDGDGDSNDSTPADEIPDPEDDEDTLSQEDFDLSDIADGGESFDISDLSSLSASPESPFTEDSNTIFSQSPGEFLA